MNNGTKKQNSSKKQTLKTQNLVFYKIRRKTKIHLEFTNEFVKPKKM